MLKIIHFTDKMDFLKYDYKEIKNSHLVSYLKETTGEIVICKSRWFAGEYPYVRDTEDHGHLIVTKDVYYKIANDTINFFLK